MSDFAGVETGAPESHVETPETGGEQAEINSIEDAMAAADADLTDDQEELSVEEEDDAEPAPETEEGADNVTEPPADWDEQEVELFAAMSPEAQALVTDKLAAMAEATEQLTEKAQLSDDIQSLVTPDIQNQLDTAGFGLVEGVNYLLQMQDFSTRDPVGYLQFAAQQLGIDLSGGQLEPGDQYASLMQENAQLQQRLSAVENTQSASVVANAQKQVDDFANAKGDNGEPMRPYFEEVREQMGRLMSADENLSLDQAYEQAIWSNPDTRKKLQDAERKAEAEARAVAAKKAKRAGRNVVRSSTGAVSTTPEINSIEDAMNAAEAELGGI